MTAPAPVPDGTTPPRAVLAAAVQDALDAIGCELTTSDCRVAAAAVVAALRLPERDRETAAKAPEPGDAARLHLIQYRDPDGFHSTTVACWDHESAILAVLRAEGIGCSATTAPILSRCDGCENDRERASALRERRGS